MKLYELAQLNVARMRYPMDAPEMAGFVEQIDRAFTPDGCPEF